MNRLYVLLLLTLFLPSCDLIHIGSTTLFPVKKDGVYGYINRRGNYVVSPGFVRAGCFDGGVAVVALPGNPRRWGYIDNAGRFVIKPQFCYATSFSEGIAFVVAEGGAPTAIDKNGVTLFTVPEAQSVSNFSDGLAAYSIMGPSGELWGYIDKSGTSILFPQYNATSYFSEGMCGVMNGNGDWGYIDRNGELVIDYVYDNVHPFVHGMAKIVLRGKWGVIDRRGRSVIPTCYNDVDVDGNMFLVKKDDKWGWIDKDENEIIPIRFADAYPFNGNRLAPARLGNKWGYIDVFGKYVVPAKFDFAFGFDGGLGVVEVNGKYGFINEFGAYVVEPTYDHLPVDYFIRYFANTTAFYEVKTDIERPINVAYKWLNGFYHLDFYEANRYATRETKLMLNQYMRFSSLIADSSKKRMDGVIIGIKDCQQNGNRAIVTYTLSDNRNSEQNLFLVKEGEKWLVKLPEMYGLEDSTTDLEGNFDTN